MTKVFWTATNRLLKKHLPIQKCILSGILYWIKSSGEDEVEGVKIKKSENRRNY